MIYSAVTHVRVEPGLFFGRCSGESLPLRVDFIHRMEFGEGIAKGKINKMKRQLTDWEKIFSNFVINNGLVSKIHKQHHQNNPIKTWVDDLNRHFSKDIQMAKKHMKNVQHC